MVSIRNDLKMFTEALERGRELRCDETGNWHVDSLINRVVRSIFGWSEANPLSVSRVFGNYLDQLEGGQSFDVDWTFRAAKAVRKSLVGHQWKLRVRRELSMLDLRVSSLRYRLETIQKGEANPDLYQEAEAAAVKWKKSMKLYGKNKSLTAAEKEKVKELCCYPEFIKALLKNPRMLSDAFKCLVRDNLAVRPLVEFPAFCQKLKRVYLCARIGRFGPDTLRVETINNQKVLTLPFEVQEGNELKSRRISILNGSTEVNLKNNFKVTIKKVFEVFKRKNFDPGKLEFFGKNGISNWNTMELGPWNPATKSYDAIDLSQPQWWDQIPEYEELTPEQIKKRYGVEELKAGEWVALARSTSESIQMDIDKSHGYISILIPNGKGHYQLIGFGKYAERWPRKPVEKLRMIANTVKAKIITPDENDYYAHRRQAIVPFVMSEGDGKRLMNRIKQDLEIEVAFQFAWENCAYWVQKILAEILGERVPNLFRAPAAEAEPGNVLLSLVFKLLGNVPETIRNLLFTLLEIVLLSWRGVWVDKRREDGSIKKVFKSTWVSEFHNSDKKEMFHPSLLHKKIIAGKVPGVIRYGHTASS